MALVIADRVRETSTTAGTGTFTLGGAVTGYKTFGSAIGSGNTTYYVIANSQNGEWEVGVGTVGSGTLARTTLLSSSTGSTVDFAVGTKDVFVAYPSEKAVYTDNVKTINGNSIIGSGDITISGGISTGKSIAMAMIFGF
jgi:hypothetical protein